MKGTRREEWICKFVHVVNVGMWICRWVHQAFGLKGESVDLRRQCGKNNVLCVGEWCRMRVCGGRGKV